jgi:hypothetical protein
MNKTLQNKLIKAFPKLYRETKLPMTKSCMGWGIDVGDGWFQLIWGLSQKLEAHIKKSAPKSRAVQVKEKFGTLRFYLDGSTEAMQELVHEAEAASASTCERCGQHGVLKKNPLPGWWHVSCAACEKVWYKE